MKDFDSILDHFVGHGGPLQWRQFSLLLLQGLASTVPFYLHLFAVATPDHRCVVKPCEGSDFERWSKFAIPIGQGDDFLKIGTEMDQCSKFEMLNEVSAQCISSNFDRNHTQRCDDGYVYDRSQYEETLVTELNLVCNGRRHEKLLGTVMMIGLTVGCFVGGPIGDKLGRRTALLTAVTVLAPLVIAGGFVGSYELYVILRLFSYVCVSVMWITSHALILELFGLKWRKLAYVANSVWLCLINLVLVLIVFLERHWTYMHLWAGAVVVATLPPLFLGITESVRWMAVNDRSNEAEETINAMIKSAGTAIDESQMKDISKILKNLEAQSREQDERRLSLWDMFGATYLRQTLAILTAWISSVVAYYAIALNATALAGDTLLNFTLSSLADVPSSLYVLVAVDLAGRRLGLSLPLIALSCCCLAMAFVPKTYTKVILALFLIGKFSSSCALNVIWLYTAELYPTNLRVQAVGTCSLISRVFGALAPFVEDLSSTWKPLPFLVLGIPAVIAAIATLFLRETKEHSLPDIKENRLVTAEAEATKNADIAAVPDQADSKLMNVEQ